MRIFALAQAIPVILWPAVCTSQVVPRLQQDVIPLIVMDSVPLPDAVRNLASVARLGIALDPKQPVALTSGSSKTLSDFEVSLRWENLTGEQALGALLDNFDLAMIRETGTPGVRIVPKPKAPPSR